MGEHNGHAYRRIWNKLRLAPVLKTFFDQCVISYTCSQTNSDGRAQTNSDGPAIRVSLATCI